MNLGILENLQRQAETTYNVNALVFIVLYVITVPVYYYGEYLMLKEGFVYFKEKFHGKKNLYFTDLLSHKGFIKGLIVNRFGWFAPYIYVILFGKNLPFLFYFLVIFWLFLTTYLYLQKTHTNIIDKEVVYKAADNKTEIKARRLVSRRFDEAGYLKTDVNAPFFDKYVKNSKYFVAEHDGEIEGTIRIVKNVSKTGIPTLNEFEIDNKIKTKVEIIPQKNIAEIGNLAAVPGHNVAKGLYRTALKYCLKNKYKYVFASIDYEFFNRLNKNFWMLRFFYKVVGKPKHYVGSVSVPILLKPRRIMLLFL